MLYSWPSSMLLLQVACLYGIANLPSACADASGRLSSSGAAITTNSHSNSSGGASSNTLATSTVHTIHSTRISVKTSSSTTSLQRSRTSTNSSSVEPSTGSAVTRHISDVITPSYSTRSASQHATTGSSTHLHHVTPQSNSSSTVWWEIDNGTIWTSFVSQPSPTSSSEPRIWSVPLYTGSISNVSLSNCYASWQTYFKHLKHASTSYSESEYKTTITSTINPGITGFVLGTTTVTSVSTESDVNGGFTLSERTATSIWTETGSLPQFGAPTPTTITTRKTASYPVIINPPAQPTCALPSVVPQCQSQWESYLNKWYPTPGFATKRPQCHFASMDTSACWSLRDEYVTFWNAQGTNYPYVSNGYSQIATTEYYGNYVAEFAWPRYSSLAPACTLGCARCAMTGGTIQLYYWPATSTYDTASGPVTAIVDSSTLTYPTIYVSYREIFASDSCGPVGPSVTNTLVAIPTPSLISSIYGSITELAPAFTLFPPALETEAFNISDLNTPVPYSIYEKQPWCQSLLNSWSSLHYAWGPNPPSTRCPTTDPYKPILYLPSAILNSIDPLWATCSGDVRGVYDPPSALHPVASAAQATFPGAGTTTTSIPASPEPVRGAPTPTPTTNSMPSPPPSYPRPSPSPYTSAISDQQPYQTSIRTQRTSVLTLPGASGHTVAVSGQDGTVLISAPDARPTRLTQGQQATVHGVAISVASAGSAIVVGGSRTLAVPYAAPPAATASFTVPTGPTLAVSAASGIYYFSVDGSTTALSAGQTATLAGIALSVPSTSNMAPPSTVTAPVVVVDGNKITLSAISSTSAATKLNSQLLTLADGQSLRVGESGCNTEGVIVSGASTVVVVVDSCETPRPATAPSSATLYAASSSGTASYVQKTDSPTSAPAAAVKIGQGRGARVEPAWLLLGLLVPFAVAAAL